jgi:hypothetical protein
MSIHTDTIQRLGGPHALARLLGGGGIVVKEVTVRAWQMRDSIPARYWQPISDVARAEGHIVSIEALAQAAAAAPESQPLDRAREAA